MSESWIHFGWQGLEWEMPEDWTLGKVEGDRASGYVRIDDEHMVRLEARWQAPKGGEVDFDTEIEKQVREVKKRLKKTQQEVKVRRHVKLVEREPARWECYHMRADFQAWNMVNSCPNCGRVVMLRLFHEAKEPAKQVAERLFESLSDHREDCHDVWDVFGLSVSLPSSFELASPSLKTGEIRLDFARGREQIVAHRVSLAEMILRETTLSDWVAEHCRKEWQPFHCAVADDEYRGDESCLVSGRRKLHRRLVSPFSPKTLKCRTWYCKEIDKLFILRAELSKDESAFFDDACKSIHCH